MRLLVLALTALAFAQPALAREHVRHHHWAHAVRSNHYLARSYVTRDAWRPAAASRQRVRLGDARVVERSGGYDRPQGHGELDAMIARHAQMNGLPEALVHRVVIRESRYNPGVVGAGGAMGLMQIKVSTARAMGYTGSAAGLLDPETNLTYAVRYLAGAYRVAGGNADRAVGNYARGYRDATVREGATSQPRVASSETWGWSNSSGWTNSYASTGPIERIAWVQTPARRYQHRRQMRSQ
jgi:soluble lytic murein transglycosylase-like protein